MAINDATNNYKSIVGAFAYTSMMSLEEKMNQVMMQLTSQNLLFKEAKVAVPDNVLDRGNKIESSYTDRKTNEKCKSIIVRLNSFRHRALFHRAKKNLKREFKVRLYLTKSRFNLWKNANDHVKEIRAISFCYADVHSRLRVKFHDVNQKDIFFSTFEKLYDIVNSIFHFFL